MTEKKVSKRSPNAGRPKHRPTAKTRTQVETLAGIGMSQIDICHRIGLGSKLTLEKYYRRELDIGMVNARGVMLRAWYQDCLNGTAKDKYSWLRIFGPEEFRQDRQRVEVTGEDGGPVEVLGVPMTPERISNVVRTLAEVLPPSEDEEISLNGVGP